MATTSMARRPNGPTSLWRRDPFTALREEMNDLRVRILGDEDEGWFSGSILPPLDMSETDTEVDVRLDLPGLVAKDIDVQVNGSVLTVSGQRQEEKEERGRTFHRTESRYGNFSRSVTLPCAVVENEVAAEYCDGVLMIKLPKAEDAKTHKIKVKS